MSLVIMAYTNEVLKEYFLPNLNNADYSIILSSQLYHLRNDLKITLEVIKNQWKFPENSEYQIYSAHNSSCFNRVLENGNLMELKTPENIKITFLIVESEQMFQVFQKYDISNMTEVYIGSAENNHIQYQLANFISHSHAILQYTNMGWVLYDVGRNGIFIDSKRISDSRVLKFGDCITIFGLRIVFLGNMLAVCHHYTTSILQINGLIECYLSGIGIQVSNERKKNQYFKRSPRNMDVLYQDEIEIDPPPTIRKSTPRPLFMIIGPAFTMAIPMLIGSAMAIIGTQIRGGSSGVYMFTGLFTAIASAGVGVFWGLTNVKYSKQQEREAWEQRYNAYGSYLIETANYIKEKYEYNAGVLNQMYIPASKCCQYTEENPNLWNRNFTHEDFLKVRLGIGDIPFQAEIKVPKQKFSLETDELMQKPEELKENYKILYQVPICIDLNKKTLIGLVGGKDINGAIEVARAMVAQIAVNNCYTDVKMVFFYHAETEEEERKWDFVKWLPHVWSEDRRIRYVAKSKEDARDVCYEISKILRERLEEDAEHKDENSVKPHFVIFIQNQELLEGELLSKYIMDAQASYGLTSIIMAEKYQDLPNACEDIIQNDGYASQIYNIAEGSQHVKEVEFDSVRLDELEILARRLSGIEVNEVERGGEIPNSLDFFEMAGVSSLEQLKVIDRWRKNRTYDSMKALIGKKSGGADCYLDIHEKYHGPHGLIAGTTGSGKSETLQTYILSLAVNFSPDDVGFFIIDFKGGGMANLFSKLPHLIGQISNLSGNQVRRAMISIKSENMRRQRIFSEHSVNNINLYTRLYKNGEATIPVPHLFIIIDEFAELKREEPEFMKELISVAQVGRSLGVHLILATQKPSGTVDDNIWSNSKFRLCLRVQDRQDSNDMLHKPDAAYITQAGRGYLQVGNDEIYELFQSGYSGAIYDEDIIGNKSSIATMLTLTGKTAIVGNTTKRRRAEQKRLEWLQHLTRILREETEKMECNLFECVHNALIFEELMDRVYAQLQLAGFDYERTNYNTGRIKEYIGLWESLEQGTKKDSEIAELIQKKATLQQVKLPELKDKTQLDVVVDYLNKIAKEQGYQQKMSLWLPVLPTMLPLGTLEEFTQNCFNGKEWKKQNRWTLDAVVGLYDDPENQAQEPLVIDFAENGHHAICGTVATGKSTFLQTAVYSLISKYTPEELNVYILDFSSHMMAAMEMAGHIGGIIYDTEEEKLNRFFNMLEKMMDDRKKLLRGGNYSQYVQVNGITIPAILIVIDNFAGYKEKTKGAYENTLIRLSREGVGYGMFLLVSAAGFGSTEITSRIGDNIRTVISLDMGDKFKFAEVLRTTRVEILPEADVKGRGLAFVNGALLEFQTAVAFETEDDYQRTKRIEDRCKEMVQAWSGKCARKIPEIPEKPMLRDFVALPEYKQMIQLGDFLPFAYHVEDASLAGINLRKTYCFTISGRTHTGKTNILKSVIYAASKTSGEICIIENGGSELQHIAEEVSAQYITNDEEMFAFFKDTVDTFKQRNVQKRQLLKNDIDEDELYDAMQNFKHIYIFVADIPEFIQSIYRRQENGTTMNAYLENITEKGSLHNFYFIGCINPGDEVKVLGLKVYSNWISYKTGVHVGGHIVDVQKIYNFTNIPYLEQDKGMKKGMAYITGDEESVAQTIVIPLAKGGLSIDNDADI